MNGRNVQREPWHNSVGEKGETASRSLSPRKRPRPGLNIVTNLQQSSNRSLTDPDVSRAVDSQRPKMGARAATNIDSITAANGHVDHAAPAFVNLNDIRNLIRDEKTTANRGPEEKKRGRNPFRPVGSLAPGKPQEILPTIDSIGPAYAYDEQSRHGMGGNKDPIDWLHVRSKPQDKPIYDISPSDRTIVIGLEDGDIPGQIIASADRATEVSRQPSQKTPVTPSIFITPADDTAPWKYLSDDGDHTAPKRPTSSIYSQSTAFAKHFTMAADAPPVPPLPNSSWKSVDNVKFPTVKPRRGSLDSWEQNDSPTEAKDHDSVTSDNSERGILGGLTTTVVSARPRSNGWWNLISPILTRTNTAASKKTPTTKEERPPLPERSRDQILSPGEKDWQNDTSPDTPRRNGAGKDTVSTWSRWSDWERDREFADGISSAGLTPDIDRNSRSPRNVQLQVPEQSSPMSPPVVAGLAAEYFLACAHDNISPMPYFECENHSCSERLPQLASKFDPIPEITGERAQEINAPDQANSGGSIKSPSSRSIPEPPMATIVEDAREGRGRSDSESTMIDDESEDEPDSVKTVQTPRSEPAISQTPLPAPTPTPKSVSREVTSSPVAEERVQGIKAAPFTLPEAPPRRVTRFPPYPPTVVTERQPPSPGPLSPEAQRVLGPHNGTAMSELQPTRVGPTFLTNNYYTHLPPRPNAVPVPVTKADDSEKEEETEAARHFVEFQREKEKEYTVKEKGHTLPRNRSPVRKGGCFGRGGQGGKKKKMMLVLLIALGLLSVVIVSIVLAITLTRKGDHTPVQSQWVNLTGFPPMPTGISTIAQPNVAEANSECVQGSAVWSCALPREELATLTSSEPDQPNFRLEIRFRNGTVANGTESTTNSTTKRATRHKRFEPGHKDLYSRDAFTDALYTPSPAPPSLAEQSFLGNTTDNTTSPFEGEATPFFITFLSPSPLNQTAFSLAKRQDQNDTGNTNSSLSTLKSFIPGPSTNSNGTASPANLLPYPISQPVRLYDRGLTTEHYGFYTYFDRSIFLSSASLNDSSSSNASSDATGGVPESEANLRCTWAQTRFLVQIWTNPSSGFAILPSAGNVSKNTIGNTKNSTESSALQLSRPGSFPYPVSITLDRHGGALKKKMIYCYDLDSQQRPIKDSAQLVQEFRAAGGIAVNAAPGLFSLTGDDSNTDVDSNGDGGFDTNAGGIDGGTGGCGCRWNNFQ